MAIIKSINLQYANPKKVMKAFCGGKPQMCSLSGFVAESEADNQFLRVARYLHARNEEGNVQVKYDFAGLGRVICKMTEGARIAALDDIVYFVSEYEFRDEKRCQLTFATISGNSDVDEWTDNDDDDTDDTDDDDTDDDTDDNSRSRR